MPKGRITKVEIISITPIEVDGIPYEQWLEENSNEKEQDCGE